MPIIRKNICIYPTPGSQHCNWPGGIAFDSYSVPAAAPTGAATVTITNTGIPAGRMIEAVWWNPYSGFGVFTIPINIVFEICVGLSANNLSVIVNLGYNAGGRNNWQAPLSLYISYN